MTRRSLDPRGASPTPIPFLVDARRNLRAVQRQCGAHSLCYRRLRRRYARVARELGCALAWQRQWHRLRRRAARVPDA